MSGIGSAAMAEARRLGHGTCGEEHLLVAWLASDLAAEQRQELDRRGLTPDAARAAVSATRLDPTLPEEARSGTWSAPSRHTAFGRANGLSLARDQCPPSAADVAVASVWDGDGPAAAALAWLGCTRDDVLAVAGPPPASRPPEILLPLAEGEAGEREDGWVAVTHVVLALLAGRPDGLAAAALGACGITYDRMAASHQAMHAGPPAAPPLDPARRRQPSPACRAMIGRAEGLAAARGARSVGSEHALLAWLWQDEGQGVGHLEQLGTIGPEVLGALVAAGATVPAVAPPGPDRREWGERVVFPIDRLPEVRAALVGALRPGEWGWNADGDVGWAIALAGIDLRPLVDAGPPDRSLARDADPP